MEKGRPIVLVRRSTFLEGARSDLRAQLSPCWRSSRSGPVHRMGDEMQPQASLAKVGLLSFAPACSEFAIANRGLDVILPVTGCPCLSRQSGITRLDQRSTR